MSALLRETWSDEDIATLRRMAKEGASMLEISRVLGRTLGSVLTKATKLKIKVVR